MSALCKSPCLRHTKNLLYSEKYRYRVKNMFRLGVAVKILGRGGLRARDGRRAENAPHLSVSLLLVREVLLYLAAQQIGCYRLADDLLPYLGDGRYPEVARQIAESAALLDDTGTLAQAHGIRLSIHLPLWVTLATTDAAIVARSVAIISARAQLLDGLRCGPEGVLVLHVGGTHSDKAAALRRWAARYLQLPHAVRQRLALEADDNGFTFSEVLWLHQATGVPIVFDALHHRLNNPEQVPMSMALALALASWPPGVRPKVHFSTQRTEAHLLPARHGAAQQVVAPQLGQHADFVDPGEFVAFLRAAHGLAAFDIMLEAKASDLALLRLRADVARIAPELVGVVS